MFDVLVWSVLRYGVEIWGWKDRKSVESLQEIPKMCNGGELELPRIYVERRDRARESGN